MDLETDIDLARFLGVKKGTLAGWRYRDKADLDTIIQRCHDVNLNWLFRGHGKPRLTDLRTSTDHNLEPTVKPEDDLEVPVLGRYLYPTAPEPALQDYLMSHSYFLRDWLERDGRCDPESAFVCKFNSMAMSPHMESGDLVIAERSEQFVQPGLYVFWYQGNIEVRHALPGSGGRWLLLPQETRQFSPVWHTDEWEVLGVVKAVVQSLRFLDRMPAPPSFSTPE